MRITGVGDPMSPGFDQKGHGDGDLKKKPISKLGEASRK
jgi:hypothetical protein